MTIAAHKTKIRTVRKTDHDFNIVDGVIISGRAGFEIDQDTPKAYALIITECINRGWLRPVAFVEETRHE